jgi:hypothetical protein
VVVASVSCALAGGRGGGLKQVISTQAWAYAERLWEFQQMRHEPRPCSVAIGLGSHGLGVADTMVDLYERGMMPLIVFTGAASRTTREHAPC